MKRLTLAIRRLLAQWAIGWVVTFTPDEDHETFVALGLLLEATERDEQRTEAEFNACPR